MDKKLKYGLLGCGMMGREHLQNIALIDAIEVTAIVEPNQKMREKAQPLAPRASFFSNLDELLDQASVDALVIATPNYQHAEQLLSLMAKSQLPILVEKPIVTQAAHINQIASAAKAHPAPIWVAMEYRFMPPIAQFHQQLQQSAVGDLKTLSIKEHRFPFLKKVDDWNRFNENSGGTLVEKCCHFFDLLRLLSGDEVSRVYASAGQDNNHLTEQYQGRTPDIIDNAFVTLDFVNGKRALLELNMFSEGAQYQEEITAIGSQAKLECFVPGSSRAWPNPENTPAAKIVLSPRRPKGPVETQINVDAALLAAGDHNGSTYYQHLGFYQAITENKPVQVSVNDGLKAVVIGLAAQHSAEHGCAVNINPDGLGFSAA